jgi:hypothetical protein
MAFLQGAPLPDIKTTETKVDVAPKYYTDHLTGLAASGQAAMARSPSQSVAGYDPLQVMGYGALPAASTAAQPGMQAAQATAAQAAQGITPERIQALMNPYTSNVVDEMGRLSQQNVQRNLLPTMKAGFVGTGGLGSQRYAGALGQSMADIQAGLTGQQYGALSKGYSEALKGALDEAQLQNLAAGTQGKLADMLQTQEIAGAGALTKAGAERQTYEQSLLDQPLKTATNASALLRGYTMPGNQTSTFTGPKAGSYQASDLQNILTSMTGLGSAMTPAGIKAIGGLSTGLAEYLKGITTGNKGLFGDFNVDPKEFAGTNASGVGVYFDPPTGKYYDSSGKEVAVGDDYASYDTGGDDTVIDDTGDYYDPNVG